MTDSANDGRHTIAVELAVPSPRGVVTRVKHWLLAGGSKTRPSELSPLPGRRYRHEGQQSSMTGLYNSSW